MDLCPHNVELKFARGGGRWLEYLLSVVVSVRSEKLPQMNSSQFGLSNRRSRIFKTLSSEQDWFLRCQGHGWNASEKSLISPSLFYCRCFRDVARKVWRFLIEIERASF